MIHQRLDYCQDNFSLFPFGLAVFVLRTHSHHVLIFLTYFLSTLLAKGSVQPITSGGPVRRVSGKALRLFFATAYFGSITRARLYSSSASSYFSCIIRTLPRFACGCGKQSPIAMLARNA